MAFVSSLLDWYQKNARRLPWRLCQSPYRTWISEVMLQQTQVDTVIPYFERWMKYFPDIQSLAEADEQAVLSLWEGLGYYSRAHNLHQAAKMVMAEYGGQLPHSVEELEKLPGIGPYTAGAIAAIAFGADVPAVDGNIRRVFTRLFNIEEPIRSPNGEKTVWALVEKFLPKGQGGAYVQGLMDLGATICTAKKPACDRCPLSNDCKAYQLGLQEERPVKYSREKTPHYTVTAAVIRRDGKVLLAKRPVGGLLGGLWEFPGGTLEETDADLQSCLKREIQEELGVTIRVGQPFGKYKHAYTHFKISLHAFICELLEDQQPQNLASDDLAWVKLEALQDFPMGKVDRQIALRLEEGSRNGFFPI